MLGRGLSLFQRTPTLGWLIAINILAYVSAVLGALVFHLSGADTLFYQYYYKLALPAAWQELLRQPWSVITHMFIHDVRNFWHVLLNMLWLYWMGRLLTSIQPESRIGWVYCLAGLGGALGYGAYTLSKGWMSGYALGASAAVNGVVLATVVLIPYHRVFLFFIGPIALRWVGLIWIFLDFVTALSNEAVAIAHLSGSGAGLLIGYAFRSGWKPEQLIYQLRLWWEGPKEVSQEEIDYILEKIHAKGIKSLTRRERKILQRATERL
jgi:membrane associated rhomboid family serine protease